MPQRAPTICSFPLCPAIIPSGIGGRCAKHARDTTPKHALSRHERGYDSTYVKARAALLAQHPVCQVCHVRPSQQAHHTVKARDGGDHTSMVAICRSCHGRATAAGR